VKAGGLKHKAKQTALEAAVLVAFLGLPFFYVLVLTL